MRRRARTVALALALAPAGSACVDDPGTDPCTGARKAGLMIYVRDADTLAPLFADVVVADGAYVEAYAAEDAVGGAIPRYPAAEERPGEYAITAASPGHASATESASVVLTADGCNVETVTVRIDLAPAPE